MCGRYTSTLDTDELAEQFDLSSYLPQEVFEPDYNVAPTKTVRVVRAARVSTDAPVGGRELMPMRWGLIPSYAADPKVGARMINARVETVSTSRAFASAYSRRRCIVPADGWYEWRPRAHTKGKDPFYLTRGDGRALAFAGLWEHWRDGDQRIRSFSIITTPATGQLEQIHDRMPFLLREADWGTWLDTATAQPEDVAAILRRPDTALGERLELRPVGAAVGNVANNGPELIAAVGDSVAVEEATLF